MSYDDDEIARHLGGRDSAAWIRHGGRPQPQQPQMNPEDFVDKTWKKLGAFEAALIQNYETHKGQPLNRTERLDLLRYIDDAVSAENPTPQQQMVLRVTRYKAIANQIASELTPGQLKSFVGDVGKHRLRRSLSHVDGLDMFGLGPPADPPMYSRSSREQINAYNRGTSFLPDDPAPAPGRPFTGPSGETAFDPMTMNSATFDPMTGTMTPNYAPGRGPTPLGPQGSTVPTPPPFEPEPQMGQRPISLWDASRNTRILEPGSTPFAMGPASSPVSDPRAAAFSDMGLDPNSGFDPSMNFEDYGPGYSGLDDERLPGAQFAREADRPVTGAEAKAARAALNRRLAEAGLPLEGDGPVTTRMADPNYRSPRSPGLRMNNVVKGQGDLPPAPPGLLSTLVQPPEGQRPGSMTQGSILGAFEPEVPGTIGRPTAQQRAQAAAQRRSLPPDSPEMARGRGLLDAIPDRRGAEVLPDYPASVTGIPGTAQDFGVQQRAQGRIQGNTLATMEDDLNRLRAHPLALPEQIRAAEDRVQQVATLMARGVDEENIREFFTTVTGQERFRGNTPENQWLRPDSPSYAGTPPLPDAAEGLRFSQLTQNVDPESGAENYSNYLGSRPPEDPTRLDLGRGDMDSPVRADRPAVPRTPEARAWDDVQNYLSFNRQGLPPNDFDRVENAPPPRMEETGLENPWNPGGVRQLDPDSGLPLSELEAPGVPRPLMNSERFDMEGRRGNTGRVPLAGLEDAVARATAPNPQNPEFLGRLGEFEARQAAILARQPAGVGTSPAQPTGLPLDMSSPGPNLSAPRGGAPSMTGAPDMTDLFSRLSQRLGKALPAINTGMTALGVGGNLLDLYGMNDFNRYITEQNAQGGIESGSGSRVPVDPGMASMYSGLGMAIPFLGSMMFNRNKFMDDPAYRDRFLYGDNVPVAS